jgi:hypothetical protein
MFKFNESENIMLPGEITYSSVTSTFLFWEIEREIYPKRKIIIRLKRK